MPFVSITRLRLRSVRYLPRFALHTQKALRQVRRAPGFRGGSLLRDRKWAFWTMTVWDSHDSMRGYMTAGAHKTAMPLMLDWCDEASVTHWDQPDDRQPSWQPSWQEAEIQMRQGRPSKVKNPSPDHAGMTYQGPRYTSTIPIRKATG